MLSKIREITTATATAATLAVMAPTASQAYQVDCAILLCLSGGWPASAECMHARAVFIRRVTPFPVEPPLQIWLCPMGIADGLATPSQRLMDLAFSDAPPAMTTYHSDDHHYDTTGRSYFDRPRAAHFDYEAPQAKITSADLRTEDGTFDHIKYLHLSSAQRADIDISGPDFDFIRSIRVYDVRKYLHYRSGSQDECMESSRISVGSYGSQGEYLVTRASPDQMPTWVLPSTKCRAGQYPIRGVGIEWTSYAGANDHEWIRY